MVPKNLSELHCPQCRKILVRTPRYANDGAHFIGNDVQCPKCKLQFEEVANLEVARYVEQLRKKRYMFLLRSARKFRERFEVTLSKAFEGTLRFSNLGSIAEVRLLVFKSLSLRYRVSLLEICKMLLRIRRPRGSGTILQQLNWPITRLTGPEVIRKLEDEIRARYPHDEAVRAWRNEQRQEMVNSLLPGNLGYIDRIKHHQRLRRMLEKEAAVRPYRGSPWSE